MAFFCFFDHFRFCLKNTTSSTTSTTQQKYPVNQEDPSRKTADGLTKDENYHMIPIDRKEMETNLTKNSNDEQQSKAKEGTTNQEIPSITVSNEKSVEEKPAENDE